MKVEPTGVVFDGVCSIQSEKCTATNRAAITAVFGDPTRIQINTCGACLEEQVRAGEWEIRGARVRQRADVAVFSRDMKLQLVVEVKKASFREEGSKDHAIRIHRNLI